MYAFNLPVSALLIIVILALIIFLTMDFPSRPER
jgi:hypothetical protein